MDVNAISRMTCDSDECICPGWGIYINPDHLKPGHVGLRASYIKCLGCGQVNRIDYGNMEIYPTFRIHADAHLVRMTPVEIAALFEN